MKSKESVQLARELSHELIHFTYSGIPAEVTKLLESYIKRFKEIEERDEVHTN